jgi:hypothetical protein
MLRITKRQMVALGNVQRSLFVDALVQRLRHRYPVQLEKHDDEQLRVFVDAGIRQARVYGLVSRSHVRFYIDLLALHGKDFDASPRTAWAGKILHNESLDAYAKVAQLDQAQSMLEKARA